MKRTNQHPDLRNQPLRLGREEMEFPTAVLEEFFGHFHLEDARSLLWEWLTGAMASTHELFSTPQQRANMIFFYEHLESLVEAAYLLSKKSGDGQ